MVHMAGATDVGRVRSNNEDAIEWDERLGLAILADGMGGHRAGEVASRTAAQHVKAELARPLALWDTRGEGRRERVAVARLVKAAVEQANLRVYEVSSSGPQYAGMGTTIVVAVFLGHCVTVCHVGDSRLYRLRDAQLEQLTEDHSLVQELVRRGHLSEPEARVADYRNVLMRALGVEPQVRSELRQHRIERGDIYLLCSDGLSNQVTAPEIEESLQRCGDDLEGAASELIELANARGGADNISVIVTRIGAAPVTEDAGSHSG